MNIKKKARVRRGKKARMSIKRLGAMRLTVNRTPQHIYAQIFSEDGTRVLAAASTLEKALKSSVKTTGNIEAAKAVGALLAERAKKAGVETVAFDRAGFRYHGRVKALADAAREGGIQF